MISKILVALLFTGCINVSLIFLYRKDFVADKWFRVLLITGNFIGVYVSQLIMGGSSRSLLPIAIALIAGISIGLQGASVIIKIGDLEEKK